MVTQIKQKWMRETGFCLLVFIFAGKYIYFITGITYYYSDIETRFVVLPTKTEDHELLKNPPDLKWPDWDS